MNFLVNAPTNESVAVSDLPVVRRNAALKLSVAVNALTNSLLAARLPMKLRVAVNPAFNNFLVNAPMNESVAEKVLPVNSRRFPANDKVAVKPESISFFVRVAVGANVAVKV